MEVKTIKKGDLVTVDLGVYCTASNTYRVEFKLSDKSILSHPLAPECYIIKTDKELNNVIAALPNSTEKCLQFATKHRNLLDYNISADLDALCLYFVVKKDLTRDQKKHLSMICGQVAKRLVQYDIRKAVELVNFNQDVLDDFNRIWYNRFESLFQDVTKIKTKNQKQSMFNITGFVLAQIENQRKDSE